MKKQTKIIAILCGMALAIIMSISSSNATKKKDYGKYSFLENVKTEAVEGHCLLPDSVICGFSISGKPIYGAWAEW